MLVAAAACNVGSSYPLVEVPYAEGGGYETI
jgi:hypothetical protein